MKSTRSVPESVTPVSVLRQIHNQASGFQKGGIFVIGASFLLATLFFSYIDVRDKNPHTTLEVVMRIALLVVGLMLVIPDATLKLLEIIPLPAFMHREERRHEDTEEHEARREEDKP